MDNRRAHGPHNSSRARSPPASTQVQSCKKRPPNAVWNAPNGDNGILKMKESIHTAVPVFDPFVYGIELPHQTIVHALGFPMRLSTNSLDVIQVAEESWAGFPALFDDKSLEVRVAVSEDQDAPCPTGLAWRGQGHLLTLQSDRDNFAVCDVERGFAFAWFAPATARNHEFLRYYYLDTIANLLLWPSHLTRIHASCVTRAGRGVLFCGDSGAGKSCLAFACARNGWDLVTDEAVSLVRGSQERIVLGKPWQMHFRESAAAIFPEFQGWLASPNAAGKISVEIRTADLPEIRTAVQCPVAAVVFLNRPAGGPARLIPISAAEAFDRLNQDLPLMAESVMHQHRAALRHLVEVGCFELRYRDLDEALHVLESLTA